LHLAARVEGPAAHQKMADASRVQLVDVRVRDLLGEAAEQNTDVPRLHRDGAIAIALRYGPAALAEEPVQEGADRGRQPIGEQVDVDPLLAARPWNRQRDERWLV